MKKSNRIYPIILIMCIVTMTACGSSKSDSKAYTNDATSVEKTAATESMEEYESDSVQYERPKTEVSDSGNMMNQDQAKMMEGQDYDFNTEEYKAPQENQFANAKSSPLSTFSIDVDTASYSNIRRFLMNGEMPPKDAVRIEEMINYFDYDYPQPKKDVPFSITTEIGQCPWNDEHKLALIGIQGKELDKDSLPSSNLVFLLDVSGSMNDPDKLPLLKSAFKLLTNQLNEDDRVSIVVYAGAAGVVLDGARGDEKDKIMDAINELEAGGSTAGGEGIQLAYKVANKHFIKNGNNRVIIATDGDFNVGVSSEEALTSLIEEKRDEGTFLSVLGFGTGNYKDSKMETIADKGNGNYAYIDSIMEAKKVLVNEMGGTLFTIAKDVKIQVEFNPGKVKEYRLVGYENRMLSKEDFEDDQKDAGELGAGHTVTALYELVPANSSEENVSEDDLKYQSTTLNGSTEWMNVKLRYKHPRENESKLIVQGVDEEQMKRIPSSNFYFAAGVAEFGLLLKDSEYKSDANYKEVKQLIKKYKGEDEDGYKTQLYDLVELAENLY